MSDDLVKRARHNALADMPHYASVELIDAMADRIEELEAENARLRDALTPSGDTKAEYTGEFHISVYDAEDEDGNEIWRKVPVDWTTIKAIMAAIRNRAALKETDK